MVNITPESYTEEILVDAFNQEGCAVCRLSLVAVQQYFDALLYEDVNDPEVREKMRQGQVFCHDHSWQITKKQDMLGTAIIYREAVRAVMEDLRKERPAGGGGLLGALKLPSAKKPSPTLSRLPTTESCPACQIQQKAVTTLCGVLGNILKIPLKQSEPQPTASAPSGETPVATPGRSRAGLAPRKEGRPLDVSAAYATSRDGICVVHLIATVERCKEPAVFNWIIERQLERLDALEHLMAEIVRKSDYRFRHEDWSAESVAVPRLVEALLGKEPLV